MIVARVVTLLARSEDAERAPNDHDTQGDPREHEDSESDQDDIDRRLNE